jgi:integrase
MNMAYVEHGHFNHRVKGEHMTGSRPLNQNEVTVVTTSFSGAFALRDKALFILGLKTGFRISELLSLKVKDVWKDGQVVKAVSVARKAMKGKTACRSLPLHEDARAAIAAWLEVMGTHRPDAYLFEGQRKGKAIDRTHAYRILQDAYKANGLEGKLGSHALRKTFAHGVYEALGHDLVKTQKALGHKNINSTVSYLGFGTDAEISEAILSL